jgi:hypothetical protein
MRTCLAFAVVAALLTTAAVADIERKASVDCRDGQGMICFHVWPALPPVPGWHVEEEASLRLDANIMVKDGQTFGPSTTILVGNVSDIDEAQPPKPAALDDFIAADIVKTRDDVPGAVVTEVEPLATADGRKLRAFHITKLNAGHSQEIVYSIDGDADGKFFVMLMLDAPNDTEFAAALPAFHAMVAAYKHFAK